jgi:hypothetical protein
MLHLLIEQLEKRFWTEALQQVPEALGKACMVLHELHDGILAPELGNPFVAE